MLNNMWKLSKYYVRRNLLPLSLLMLTATFLVVLLADRIFVSIPAGHGGVLWKRFDGGTVLDRTYPEGFHVVRPWNIMNIYNLRLMEATETIPILAKNGLRIDVEILIRFRLDEKNLGELHKHMGRDYLKILVIPEVNAQTRNVMSGFDPSDIYTGKRAEIQELIQKGSVKELFVSFNEHKTETTGLVYVDDVLIKMVKLPTSVRKAIEAKEEQKHLMEQYDFILQREEKESQRKEIEARGISRFQEIIKPGISDKYLRWKGIDATLSLAKSNNSKVVIIGAGDEGLPLILGNMGDTPKLSDADLKAANERMNLLSGQLSPLAQPRVPLPSAEAANEPINSPGAMQGPDAMPKLIVPPPATSEPANPAAPKAGPTAP